MGQIEIFEILRDKRASGDDRYFTVPQIRRLLREKKLVENSATGLQTAQLESFGYFEAKRVSKKSDHWRSFRVSLEHIEEEEAIK